jgi:hypothetical protein
MWRWVRDYRAVAHSLSDSNADTRTGAFANADPHSGTCTDSVPSTCACADAGTHA